MNKVFYLWPILIFFNGCTQGISDYLAAYDQSVNRAYLLYVEADSTLSSDEKALRRANVRAFVDFYTSLQDSAVTP